MINRYTLMWLEDRWSYVIYLESLKFPHRDAGVCFYGNCENDCLRTQVERTLTHIGVASHLDRSDAQASDDVNPLAKRDTMRLEI
ncbi:hypothetical protein VTK56DRAFT_967 [Thermocarpiscus australiensis]